MQSLSFDIRAARADDHRDPLARLAARLRDVGDRIDTATGAPDQSKGFDCGVDLIEHLDATGQVGGFAVIEVLNAERTYIYGGAQCNLALWARIMQTVAATLPPNAYCIRISLGLAIHAFGEAIDEGMSALLARIQAALQALTIKTQIDQQEVLVPLELKVGYVIYPDDTGKVPFQQVTSAAAMAAVNFDLLYRDARVRRYSRELAAELSDIGRTEAQLIRSIDTANFELYFQPQVDMLTGQVTSAEALARWTSPGFNPGATGRYVGLIERTRYVLAFTNLTLRKMAAFVKRNDAVLPPNFRIGLNLSQAVFRWNPHSVLPLLSELVDEHPAMARRLSIELTESAYFNKTYAESLVQLMQDIKSMGIRLVVDDFGSGYGALRLLAENVVNAVKLDVAIVHAICSGELSSMFVRNLVYSAAMTRFDIVAEGIETQLQERKMLLHGVQYGQGYRYSAALPEREFLAYLKRGERGPVDQPWPPQAVQPVV